MASQRHAVRTQPLPVMSTSRLFATPAAPPDGYGGAAWPAGATGPQLTPAELAAGTEAAARGHATPLGARAVLPWLVVVQGLLDAEAAVSVAAELGLHTVDVVRIASGPGGRPRLRGAPHHLSPLTAFVNVVCGVHAAAVRLGVTGRASMRNGGRSAVLLHAPHKMPGFAATVVAAVLHWIGCLPLAESVAVARERCASEVDVVRPGATRDPRRTGVRCRERTTRSTPLMGLQQSPPQLLVQSMASFHVLRSAERSTCTSCQRADTQARSLADLPTAHCAERQYD